MSDPADEIFELAARTGGNSIREILEINREIEPQGVPQSSG
jgi:hypothetical protein